MARVKDLWFTTGARGPKRKTVRHPDRGGDPDAKRYLAVWIDPDGRECTRAFARKAEAAKYGADEEAKVRRGEYIDREAGKVLIEVLARKHFRLIEVGHSSHSRYESVYRIHIAPKFGKRAVGAVSPSQAAEFSRSLRDHPVTRHLAMMVLGQIFDLAVADGARRDNPVRSPLVTRPKRERTKREGWNAARIRAVAVHCGDDESLPLVAAALGLRIGEVLGLGAEDLDEDQGVVQVRRQLARAGRKFVFKLPKGGKERTVPLPHGVVQLAGRLAAGAVPVALPWLREDGDMGKPVKVPLMFTWDGQPVKALEWTRRRWKPALIAAGVIPEPPPGVYPAAREDGPHAMRHWYSTTLLDNGVSLAAVMDFMGHSRENAPLAIGVYGHVTPEAFDLARSTVDRALFGLRILGSDGTVTELRASQ